MQNLVQMIMQKWGIQTDPSVENRQGLLLSLSAGLALLLAGCGGDGGETKNSAPTVDDLNVTVDEDGVVTFELVGVDADEDELIFSLGDESTDGTVNLDGNSVTYTPNANYNGEESFTYTTTDPAGLESNVATVMISVNAVNDAPEMLAIAPQQINEDGTLTLDLSIHISDVDEDNLTLSIKSVTGAATADIEVEEVVVTPDADENGEIKVTIQVEDGNGGSAEQELTLTVNAVNDAPEVTGFPSGKVEIKEGESVRLEEIIASDVDGDSLTFAISGNVHILTEYNAADSTLTLSDAETLDNSSGYYDEILTLTVADGQSSVDYPITVELGFLNDPLTLKDSSGDSVDSLSFDEGSELTITLASMDHEGDELGYSVLDGDKIAVSLQGKNLIFTSGTAVGSLGSVTEEVIVTISDGGDLLSYETITVQMNFVDEAPVLPIGLDTITFEEDDVTADEHFSLIDLLNYVFPTHDPDGEKITYEVSGITYENGLTSGLSAVIEDDSRLIITPDENFNGTTEIEIIAKDPQGNSASTKLSIVVTPVNDAPVFLEEIPDQETNENTAISIFLQNNILDVEGDATLTAEADNNASAAIQDGMLIVTPEDGNIGEIKVIVRAIDDNFSTEDNFKITVDAGYQDPIQKVLEIDESNFMSYSRTAVNFELSSFLQDASNMPMITSNLSLYRVEGGDRAENPVWAIPEGTSTSDWWSTMNGFNSLNYEHGDYQLVFSGDARIYIDLTYLNSLILNDLMLGDAATDGVETVDFTLSYVASDSIAMPLDELFDYLDVAALSSYSAQYGNVSYDPNLDVIVYTRNSEQDVPDSDTITFTTTEGSEFDLILNDNENIIFRNEVFLGQTIDRIEGQTPEDLSSIYVDFSQDQYEKENTFEVYLTSSPPEYDRDDPHSGEGDCLLYDNVDVPNLAWDITDFDNEVPRTFDWGTLQGRALTIAIDEENFKDDVYQQPDSTVRFIVNIDEITDENDILNFTLMDSWGDEGVGMIVSDHNGNKYEDLTLSKSNWTGHFICDNSDDGQGSTGYQWITKTITVEEVLNFFSYSELTVPLDDLLEVSLDGFKDPNSSYSVNMSSSDIISAVYNYDDTNIHISLAASNKGIWEAYNYVGDEPERGLDLSLELVSSSDGLVSSYDYLVDPDNFDLNFYPNLMVYQLGPENYSQYVTIEQSDGAIPMFPNAEALLHDHEGDDITVNPLIRYIYSDTNGNFDQVSGTIISKEIVTELARVDENEFYLSLFIIVNDDKHSGAVSRAVSIDQEVLGITSIGEFHPSWEDTAGDHIPISETNYGERSVEIVPHEDVNDGSSTEYIYLAILINGNVILDSDGEMLPINITSIEVDSHSFHVPNTETIDVDNDETDNTSNNLWTAEIATLSGQMYSSHSGSVTKENMQTDDYYFLLGFHATEFNELGGNNDVADDGEYNVAEFNVTMVDSSNNTHVEYSYSFALFDQGWFNDEYELG